MARIERQKRDAKNLVHAANRKFVRPTTHDTDWECGLLLFDTVLHSGGRLAG